MISCQYVKADNDLQRFDTTLVDRDHQVQDFYIHDDDTFYVMTSQSVNNLR